MQDNEEGGTQVVKPHFCNKHEKKNKKLKGKKASVKVKMSKN